MWLETTQPFASILTANSDIKHEQTEKLWNVLLKNSWQYFLTNHVCLVYKLVLE